MSHKEEGMEDDQTLRPRQPMVPIFLPIEEVDCQYKDVILSLPAERRWLPFLLRQYQGFWQWEGVLPGIISVQQRFKPRPTDVFVATFPKSGTTWIKALTFATVNRSKYSPDRHPLLRLNPHDCVRSLGPIFCQNEEAYLESLASPRVLAFHIPYSTLPDTITASDCKIVYVCRDPKDVLVSVWHMSKTIMPEMSFPFDQAFELYCTGQAMNGPIWAHMLEYWNESLRNPHKVLFLKYEEMIADPHGIVRRLAEFLGCPFSREEETKGVVEELVQLCSFKKLKDLHVNKSTDGINKDNPVFFRKGVMGDWRNHMTPEMAQKLDEITKQKLQGSGLTF